MPIYMMVMYFNNDTYPRNFRCAVVRECYISGASYATYSKRVRLASDGRWNWTFSKQRTVPY